MPFPEKIKEEVKYRSRNCCVICKKFFRPCEVHHILPESENGSNTLDNAVLLCRNHHDEFGHKPKFVDYIIKERKNWYEYCDRYMHDVKIINERFEKIEKTVSDLGKQKPTTIDVTKDMLVKGIDTLINDLQNAKKILKKKEVTPSDISIASLYLSGQSVDADSLGSYGLSSVDENVKSSATFSDPETLVECIKCEKYYNIEEGVCPYCRPGR